MDMRPIPANPKAGDKKRGTATSPVAPFEIGRLFRWGWRISWDEARWFLPALVSAVVVLLLSQVNVQILSDLISGLGQQRPGSQLVALAIAFAVASLSLLLLQFLDRFLSIRTDLSMQRRIQDRLHRRLHAADLTVHEGHDAAELQMVVMRHSGGAQQILREVAAFPIVRTLGLGFALWLLWQNLSRAGDSPLWVRLFLFAALLGMPLIAWTLARKTRTAFQEVQASEAQLGVALVNSIQSPTEVRGLNVSGRMTETFRAVLDRHLANQIRARLRSEVQSQFQNSVPVVLQLTFLMAAVWTVLHSPGQARIGALLGIYYFVPMVVAPIRELITFFSGLQNTWPLVAGVLDLLDLPDDPLEPQSGTRLPDKPGDIVLDHITFRYAQGTSPVLDRMNAIFPAGKTTAIVARAGAGKSTILSLVARLRKAESGTIGIAGQDILGIASASLRKHVFKVSQFPLFLTDSVRENMLVANPHAADAQIEEAARRTGLWEVLTTAAGKDAPLDHVLPRDVSQGLSGGQRRLFALTRALLASPSILLLDEPTTGVDSIGRRNIARILRENFSGCTILLVDHDMQFVRELADQVVCLEAGRVAVQGAPGALEDGDNLFARLLRESALPPSDSGKEMFDAV